MKAILVAFANCIGFVFALPFILAARAGLAFGSERLYIGCAYALAIIPGDPGMLMRRAYYRSVLDEAHWDLAIHFGSVITHPIARLGRRIYIGSYCLIGRCHLGDDVIIGSRVSIPSGRRQHGFRDSKKSISEQVGSYAEIAIGKDVWIGEGAIVMADVGSGSVVGAGAVVVKPVGQSVVVVGNPAREVGERASSPSL